MIISDFSSSYYVTELLVASHSGKDAIVQSDLFRNAGVPGPDLRPMIFKTENFHVPVNEESAVPSGVLAIPKALFSKLETEAQERIEVFIAKDETAKQLVEQNLVNLDGLQ